MNTQAGLTPETGSLETSAVLRYEGRLQKLFFARTD